MQQLHYQRKFCQARELITDHELHRLASKYHHRHPTFTIDIQERTCQTIILACIYHYRHIEVNLRCRCIYNDSLHKFESQWSTDDIKYQKILDEIFLRLNSSLINRSLDDQIESIIEQLTKSFTRLNSIQEDEQQPPPSIITKRKDSSILLPPIEIIKYERSPQSRRRQVLERSVSWSQPVQNRCHLIFNEREC